MPEPYVRRTPLGAPTYPPARSGAKPFSRAFASSTRHPHTDAAAARRVHSTSLHTDSRLGFFPACTPPRSRLRATASARLLGAAAGV
eukprot:3709512-Prymnesium_polylepis.1